MRDNKRALLKTITWRVVASTDTFLISLAVMYFTSDPLKVAFAISSVEIVNKLFLYFVHEKIWQKVQ